MSKSVICQNFEVLILPEPVKYLRHIVSSKGVEPDRFKVITINEWKIPINAKEIRSFLGLDGYYQWFIKDFAKVVAPLTDLTHQDIPHPWYREGGGLQQVEGSDD